jgi:hypothetical protein
VQDPSRSVEKLERSDNPLQHILKIAERSDLELRPASPLAEVMSLNREKGR